MIEIYIRLAIENKIYRKIENYELLKNIKDKGITLKSASITPLLILWH